MTESYIVLWPQTQCRIVKRAKDRGPLEVVFGGEHKTMPSLGKAAPGDNLYVVSMSQGSLLLIAHMPIEHIMDPDDFVAWRLGITLDPAQLWDSFSTQPHKADKTIGHRIPWTCPLQAAVSTKGSDIRLDRAIPGELLEQLLLGPRPGQEKPLSGVVEQRLMNPLSLHGHTRRLSPQSAQLLHSLL